MAAPRVRSLVFKLSLRLAGVGLVFLLVQLLAVVWMYVRNPNELDQLLLTAEAGRIAEEIPDLRQPGDPPIRDELAQALAPGTRRSFVVHDRAGWVLGQYQDGDLKIAPEAPMSFLVIRTQREIWGDRFLLSGTRRVTVDGQSYWITLAISGHGFEPFVPIIFNEIRFHVVFPLALLSVLFLLFNFSVVRSTLRPLARTITAIGEIDPARPSMRVEAPATTSEVQALIVAVNGMLARIEAAVQTVRDFAGNAAHELRTPLAVLTLGIDKLEPGPVQERLSAEVRAMRRLVDQMLDMAQADALAVDPASAVDLGTVARDVVADLTPLAIAEGRVLVFEDAGAPAIAGHAEALGRALRNLVDNALAHGPPGTAVTVTSGPGPVLTVRDQGPGIPKDQRQKVLERFVRLDRSGRGGAGLGFAIVRTIVAAHGGRVEIDDAPGGGALIRLVFDAGPGA
ncbi:sensor histidine kinase [Zavarzinia sp.]|uniref:sensor histidine kinase n=1 Tax=Zavarzinia sp. TaxID=2027920 RepID=UPI003564A0BB